VLRVRQCLLNKLEHGVTVRRGPEITNPEPENELAGLEGVRLLLPMLAETNQPDTPHACAPFCDIPLDSVEAPIDLGALALGCHIYPPEKSGGTDRDSWAGRAASLRPPWAAPALFHPLADYLKDG
jgi:hypothetical protein